MDGRKQKVLATLIDDYIATAEPVGSRTLARKYAFGVSPATIRNEMADLEELGYLEHPHTSAGRIPSDKGYRYYVDRLMRPSALDPDVIEQIRATYRVRVRELQWFIHQTARLVAEMTAYPTVVLAPPLHEARLWDLRVVAIEPETVVLVLRTDTGIIQNRTLALPEGLDAKDVAAMAADFTTRFRGTLLAELQERVLDGLSHQLGHSWRLWEELLGWLAEAPDEAERVTLGGALNILNYPEFRDVSKVRRVLSFLETEAAIDSLLTRRPEHGVLALIGSEIDREDIQDCSVVMASYELGHKVVGTLMVVGPKRMEYRRVYAILETVSEELSRVLNWA
ncbi:MAG: heat-inducible transcriptional repressor HrcA [Firmicutes bacterium]|nr:heat-inducible transcription repressor HrcA [Alicyclobacillaceae bacterium]MCL6496947.1 heat-inducible transcriptional repressor HrcA [Bacillota bacterium]